MVVGHLKPGCVALVPMSAKTSLGAFANAAVFIPVEGGECDFEIRAYYRPDAGGLVAEALAAARDWYRDRSEIPPASKI